jgi:hypothetical protein
LPAGEPKREHSLESRVRKLIDRSIRQAALSLAFLPSLLQHGPDLFDHIKQVGLDDRHTPSGSLDAVHGRRLSSRR